MNIGTLDIEMAMDLARLRQDMDATKSLVGGAMADVSKVIGFAKTAFIGLAGVASAGAFVGMVNDAIEAQGALHDMSKATGLSVAALGEMRKMGAYTETSIDSIAAASLKLSKNLALTDEDGKGAALAIKALGIDFDSFVKQNPDQRMLTVAKALNGFEDGADKSAAAMLLMGKEGAKMLPFLADLGDSADDLSDKLTDQEKATRAAAAAMADNYGDNLTKIQKESVAWKKELAMGLLPALYETTESFLQVAGGAGGVKERISELARDGTLADWARGGVTALTYVLDVGQALLSLFPLVGKSIAGAAAIGVQTFTTMGSAVSKVLKGDFSGALDEMKGGFVAVNEIGTAAADDISKIWNQKLIGESFRDSMSSLRNVQAEGKEAKKQLNLVDVLSANEAAKKSETAATKAAAEEQKKLIAAYEAADKAGQDLLASLDLKNASLQQEVELGRKLTAVEAENLKLTNDMASGKVLLSKADEEAARAAIEHGAALEREIAWQQESHKANLAQLDAIDKTIESMRAETEKQREANAEMGLTTEQLGEVRKAKLLDLAVQAERKAALLDEIDWTGQLGDQQRELAQAYRDSAAVAGQGVAAKAAKEAQEAWGKTIDSIGQGLTDSLFRAFESGKDFFGTLWDGIKNTVKSTVLKVAIQGVDGKGGVAGSLLSLIGLGSPGTASAGTGGLGSLGGIGNLVSSIGSMFSGGGPSLLGSTMGEWMGQFGASFGNLAGNLGVKLYDLGLEKIGSSLIGNNVAIGNIAGIAGDALGYIGAIKGLADGKWGAGIGSGIGTFFGGPIGGAIGNVIGGFVDKIFGGNGTHHAGAGYVSDGTTGQGVRDGGFGLGWSKGDSVNKYFSQGVEDALKTITGGSANMLNTLSKAFGGAGGFQVGGWFASDNDRASMGNRSVLLNGRVLSNWEGGGLDKDATKGLQQLTDALAGQVRDAMAQIDLPTWARDALNSLGAGATMEGLANAVQAIQQTQQALKGLGDAFTPLGGVFTRIASLSGDAQLQLAGFAGGIDQLLGKTQAYVGNYYSDVERAGLSAQGIRKALAEAGITADDLATKEQFRALVDSTDISTEAGRKQLAALLNVSTAFADVAKVLEEAGGTLGSIAGAAPASQVVGLLTEPATATAQAAEQSAQLLATANDQLASISDASNASVRVAQAGFTGLIERMEALAEALQEVTRPAQLADMAR